MSDYLRKLIRSNPLRLHVIRDIINYVKLPKESKGIDVGCGYGAQMILLARTLGDNSQITGIDLSSEFLNYGNKIIENEGLVKQITFKKGNMNNLPFAENVFDWGWSMDCVGYHPSDPRSAIKELIRVIKPGGTINLLAWSSEMLLPGHPWLEAKLRATSVGLAPFSKRKNPKKHFLRLINRFQDLGLSEIKAHTFVGTIFAPFKEDIYTALVDLFEMRWEGVQSELSKGELKQFNRLCLPNSPDFILNLPDYYAFYTYSLFRGKVNN